MVKRINLALQGGGAHGAFTWGVLDRLLEDEDIEIAAISGTSAGALNGAALKAGLVEGGPQRARENLDWLWAQVGAINEPGLEHWMSHFAPPVAAISRGLQYSPGFALADAAMRTLSPYFYGPMWQNPLQRIVEKFRFDAVCDRGGPQFFICATNVRTGKIRVFEGEEIGTLPILASACLPTLFPAVEIYDPATRETEAYWDGGYTGNPALFPLFDPALPADILVININPLVRDRVPVFPQEIQNRINEISFNTSLLRELRAIAFVKRLLHDQKLPAGAMKDVLVHMISDDALMRELSVATKLVPNPAVLAQLKAAGRRAAAEFLRLHRGDLNERGTVDLATMFG